MAGGFRSPLALWVGGASAPGQRAGYRGLLAFWLGGASAAPAVVTPPTPEPAPFSGGVFFGDRPDRVTREARTRLALRVSIATSATLERTPPLEFVARTTTRLSIDVSGTVDFYDHLARLLRDDEDWLLMQRD